MEFTKTWPIRVALALIEWNHPYNFHVLFRNILQAEPPHSESSLHFLSELHSKKLYDKNRRQDPIIRKLTKIQKFKKQPISFTSPFRHKSLDETLPKDKMKKNSIFPKSTIELGSNWKQKVYFVQTESPDRMKEFLDEVNPPIFRISPDRTVSILLSRVYTNTRIDSFASADKTNISFHQVNDENWLDDIALVNNGDMIQDEELVQVQKRKKEQRKAIKEEKTTPLLSPKVNKINKEAITPPAKVLPVMIEEQDYIEPIKSVLMNEDEQFMKGKLPNDLLGENDESKMSDCVIDGINSPITEPIATTEHKAYLKPFSELGFVEFTEEESEECKENENMPIFEDDNQDEKDFDNQDEKDFDTALVKTFIIDGMYCEHIEYAPYIEIEPLTEELFEELQKGRDFVDENEEFDYEDVLLEDDLPCGEDYPFDTWPPTFLSDDEEEMAYEEEDWHYEEEDQNIVP